MSSVGTKISVLGTLLGVVGVLAAIAYTTKLPEERDIEHDRERRVVLRWEVETTRPAHIAVLAVSNIRGPQVHFEGSAVGVMTRTIVIVKTETIKLTVSGELPPADRRGSITCKIYVNDKRVSHNIRVIRSGERAGGVTCKTTVTG